MNKMSSSTTNQLPKSHDDVKMYDVSTYTDKELFNILDLDDPTDRELEAKIIFLIKKYKNIQNESGDQLAKFFEQIYHRFFEEDEEDEDEEDEEEGFTNIREGLSNQDIIKLTTNKKVEPTNVSSTTEPSSVISVNPKVESQSVITPGIDNIGYTKSLEYANGQLNPLLQQTVKRIISVDSQYRDNKNTISTEFTFNLSDPLKDVVSLKLYSVQIPYTWYTINNNFGSNFFILKGNVPGIANGNHDYQIDIAAGNYSPQELTNTINVSIDNAKLVYPDVSFGNTNLLYNSNTSLITTNIDIYKQYNETSYYLEFLESSDDESRLNTIPGFLGLTDTSYNMYHLKGTQTVPSSSDTANNETRFEVDTSNKSITINRYIGDDYNEQGYGNIIDLSFNLTLDLVDGNYTRTQITDALSNAIKQNEYLYNSESDKPNSSSIERIEVSENSYFRLQLKLDRNMTTNISRSKLQIVFPSDNRVWTGLTSCFHFNPSSTYISEMNNIISERSPLQQADNQFTIVTSPYIYLTCHNSGFDVSNNAFKIEIPNSELYSLDGYIRAINGSINETTNNDNFTKDNTLVKIDNVDVFNVQVDLTKNIQTKEYKLDLTDSFLVKEMGFASFYNLDTSSGVYTSTYRYKDNYTIPTDGYLATFSALNVGEYMTSDLSYTVNHPANTNGTQTPYLSGTTRVLENTINNAFSTYRDKDGVNVLSGTNLKITVTGQNATATLSVVVNKQLTEADYSIQFLEDLSYNITQSDFTMNVTGDNVSGDSGYYVDYAEGLFNIKSLATGQSGNIGCLSSIFDLSGVNGTYLDISTNNVFTSTFDASSSYVIDSSYIALFKAKATAGKDDAGKDNYGRSIRYAASEAYGYLIPSPSKTEYTDLTELVDNINSQFSLFEDLKGTVLSLGTQTNGKYDCALTVVINQDYNQDTWNEYMKISHTMIDTSYNLISSSPLSYSATNAYGSIALGVKGETEIVQTKFNCTDNNNTFQLVPYEEGVASIDGYNDIIFRLPLNDVETGTTISYTRARLLEEINNQFIDTIAEGSNVSIITIDGVEYTKFRITVNKEYTTKDYKMVFYDPYSFVKCFSGVSSVRNVTWDTTLGWILGYRGSTTYDLSDYTSSRNVTIVADTCISTNLFNYFLITLDDYNQNHLNDGLVTITTKDTDIPLPSYANRTNYTCDPVTKELTYNTEQRTDYSKLTQNQIYALSQTVNVSQQDLGEVSSKSYGTGPFAKDVFGIIPMKLAGLQNGQSFVEFGGTMQNQERIYFGPVNIRRMTVKLLSDRGNVVDLNNANWSFSLICEQLYKPQERASK